MELWDAFGGYSEYLNAPKRLIDKVALILGARRTVEQEREEEAIAEQKAKERDMRMQKELYG